MRTCTICPEKHYAHGFCEGHARNFTRTGNPLARLSRGLPLMESLLSRIPHQPDEGCWEWGGTMRGKYGVMKWDGKSTGAHQLMFYAVNGFFPVETRHTCDNPPCCRLDHLLAGDRKLNVQDRVERGRSARFPGRSNPNAKYTESQVAEVLRLLGEGEMGFRVAELTGVDKATVSRIKRGQR